MLTLLDIVKQFCMRNGFPAPLQVVSAQDTFTLQLLALLNDELDYINRRWRWQGVNIIGSFTSVNAETQGTLDQLCPAGFESFTPDTFWDQTLRLPIYGPLTAPEWELLKSLPSTGPFYQYRINGDLFLMNPIPPAGHVLAFEYNSKRGILSVDGVTRRRYFEADDDTPILDDTIFMKGLEWRFLAKKGLDYSEEFRDYEMLAGTAFSSDGTKPTISMSGSRNESIKPGIMVPIGNWLQP